MPAVASTPMIQYTRDGLAKSGLTILSFTNKSVDKSVSGVISHQAIRGETSITIRATDLTKTQVAAIFQILGAPPPPL